MSTIPVFARIVVPVDGSTLSGTAVAIAGALAQQGGRVIFCSVVDPALACAPAAYGVALDPGPMLVTLDDNARHFVDDAGSRAGPGVVTQTAVLHGPVGASIAAFAERHAADAIVMGTHARHGLSRAVLGSVAEAVMVHAAVPVVVVHEGDTLLSGPIAVALDDSVAARAALDEAIAIARILEATLVIVHAHEANEHGVSAMLAGAAERAHAMNVATTTVAAAGPAAETVVSAAVAYGCALIVTGTHGRGGLERAVIGSVAGEIVVRAHVPVVTVRCAA